MDRDLLARYLAQRGDFGERELFLDSLTLEDLVAVLRSEPAADPTGPAGAPPRTPDAIGTGGVDAMPSTGRVATPGARVATPADSPASAAGRPAMVAPAEAGAAAVAASERPAPDAGRGGLPILAAEAAACTRCRLHEGRQNVVFGEGDAAAEVVVVGEAPGFEEDRTGRPFVGPAGKLLDLLLLTIGLPRDRVFICNVLKCRPPNNRDPLRDEVEQCSGYLHRQLEMIAPRVLLAVGKFAAQTLIGTDASIGKLRGRVHAYRGIPLVATYHPAFLLRSPQWTRASWQDIQLLREVLDAQRAGAPGLGSITTSPSGA